MMDFSVSASDIDGRRAVLMFRPGNENMSDTNRYTRVIYATF